MLWHIELKFCTWLCSNVLQIKFECRQFVSIFVGVMPLLELKILQIHSFPHFSLTCFDILSWNFAYDFVLLYYRSSSSVVNFCVSYAPFGTQNTENIQFSALFSDMLWLIELKICTWLCFTEIKINFDCRQFASIFCGSYTPFGTLNTWNTQFTFLLHALAYWAGIFHVKKTAKQARNTKLKMILPTMVFEPDKFCWRRRHATECATRFGIYKAIYLNSCRWNAIKQKLNGKYFIFHLIAPILKSVRLRWDSSRYLYQNK